MTKNIIKDYIDSEHKNVCGKIEELSKQKNDFDKNIKNEEIAYFRGRRDMIGVLITKLNCM